jgi:osmoprotectant transport system ATP-binding protein
VEAWFITRPAETGSASPLRLNAVTCRFDGRAVLHDVDLCFPAATISAVVGASGCGKSTLLKLCNGLLVPDAGTVSVFGRPIDYRALPSLRRRIGYAVQGTGLFPHLRARDNIVLGARLAKWSGVEVEQRLGELLTLMHLDAALLDRYPHQLSGGQQQRVGLARAMMLRPEILLLDEPFAAIDPLTRADIHARLLEILAAEPVTVVLVTHDMREAMHLAGRIVVLRDGRVAVDATVGELRKRRPGVEPEQVLQEFLGGTA